MPAADARQPSRAPAAPLARLDSVDAYRGLVMLLMMAEVIELGAVASAMKHESALWNFLAHHQEHVAWRGCTLHDLIQPSFSFLVGVALPFSLAARVAKGQSATWMTLHAAWRAMLLVLLGIFLRSIDHGQTNYTFVDTLTQIGLGYLPLFLLGFLRQRWAIVALVVILVGYWTAFFLYPLAPAGFDYAAVGVPADWPHHFSGIAAHWNKNSNFAWAADRWFSNLFPRPAPFTHNPGGYSTFNFIPTLATMILGLVAGQWLIADASPWRKVARLAIAGAVTLLLGYALDVAGICPIVKRIWTPSWVLYSGGWCFWLLAAFYAVCDAAKFSGWSYPLRVIGANSIFAYVLAALEQESEFVESALQTHFGEGMFRIAGEAYEPLLLGLGVLLAWWLLLWWMYRQRLFVKI